MWIELADPTESQGHPFTLKSELSGKKHRPWRRHTQLTLLLPQNSPKMEARRRLSVISSHLRPIASFRTSTFHAAPILEHHSSGVSPSNCANVAEEETDRETHCIFCKIIRGEAPALKIYEDDTCICILDTNPLSRGHSLVIPKCHFSSLQATPSSVVGTMCSKVPIISNAVMKATGCDSFNLLVNNGAAAGQVIFHTHIHIIPRKARDCLWTSEGLRRYPLKLDQEASHLADCIREQLPFLNSYDNREGQVSSLVDK